MREGLIGFGHAVYVVAFFDGGAFAVAGGDEFCQIFFMKQEPAEMVA